MQNSENTEIRNLAKLAKSRLKNGFWEDYNSKVEKVVKTATEEGKSASNVINYCKAMAVRKILNSDKQDEEFYLKVKEILDSDGEVSNMIARLIDENLFKSLSFSERERYLFEISAKYCECKKRYDAEKNYGTYILNEKAN